MLFIWLFFIKKIPAMLFVPWHLRSLCSILHIIVYFTFELRYNPRIDLNLLILFSLGWFIVLLVLLSRSFLYSAIHEVFFTGINSPKYDLIHNIQHACQICLLLMASYHSLQSIFASYIAFFWQISFNITIFVFSLGVSFLSR